MLATVDDFVEVSAAWKKSIDNRADSARINIRCSI